MISEARKKKIDTSYQELIELCKVFADEKELKLIHKAYEKMISAEDDNVSSKGKISAEHSIEIAKIAISELSLGTVAVICALLHSLVENKLIDVQEVEEVFGVQVATIIDGFRKLSNLQIGKISAQSENFRKLFLSIVDDIRVILLKIAHRMYDMRHFDEYKVEESSIYLDEVTYLYIPIAHRLGLYGIKTELEELSMKFSNPEVYQSIQEKIKESKTKLNTFLDDFIQPIQRELIKLGYDCEFKGRPKSVSSIWNKMRRQNVNFEEVYDLLAVRIISNSELKKEKEDCWKIYSIVTDKYQPNPKRLRDWISTPKATGYESLHTTVKGPNNKWIEVQIRTSRMDEEAEKGQAAHWRYKGFGDKKGSDEYLTQVRDILENPEQINFDEEINKQKISKSNKIFIFTPNGDLKQLPHGSTVLDFAYEIHTAVGSQCNGARVNNKVVPIRYELKNGDKVEIITSKNQKPKLDWLNFVITNKAKGRIKRAMLESKYKEAEAGNEIVRRKFKNWKIPYNDETIDRVIKKYKMKTSVDLYYLVATEKIDLLEVRDFLTKDPEDNEQKIEEGVATEIKKTNETAPSESLMISDKIKNLNYSIAKCCNPILGDAVFGFVTVGKGITIHRVNCPNASQMMSKYSYRVIEVKWQEAVEDQYYAAKIKLIGDDVMGIVGDITKVVSDDLKVNMISLAVDTGDGQFEAKIKVQVKDNKHLDNLLHKLLKIKGVNKAQRIDIV